MELVTKMILKTNPLRLLHQIPLGMKLLTHGRLELGMESMKNPKEIKTMFKALEG